MKLLANLLNPMYDLGFQRVGCFPCIFESKPGLRVLAENFPERIDFIEQKEQELGTSFFPWDKVPDSMCREPKIRDVVAWSRGDLLNNENPSVCDSEWNQCQ